MEFTERHHAYIVAKFYQRLKEGYGERGLDVFVMATRRYGEQRGCRMAQRALRDGRKLDFGAYREYGEWTNTPTTIAEGIANRSETLSASPDYAMKITVCPWATQFADMGLRECGALYCRHVDSSIARGFNPQLGYEVVTSLNEGDCCLHIMRGAGLTPPGKRSAGNMLGFDYHCAHALRTFSDVVSAVLGDDSVGDGVLRDFARDFGDDMAERLAVGLDTNFDFIRQSGD